MNQSINQSINQSVMKDFTDKRWITTDTDLRTLLKQCKKCFNSTLKGNLVTPYNEIETLQLSRTKFTLIMNTNNSEEEHPSVGHWIVCHVNPITKKAILHDSLNEIERCHPKVFSQIKLFCKNRHLKLYIFGIRTQGKDNKNCGLHSLWFTHKCHQLNLSALFRLGTVFKPYSVCEREHFVMHETLSTFRV